MGNARKHPSDLVRHHPSSHIARGGFRAPRSLYNLYLHRGATSVGRHCRSGYGILPAQADKPN